MKKQILWLAPYVPYPKVRHAGGKNLNYYINYINDTGKFDITFIGLGYEDERKNVELEKTGIKSDIYYRDHSKADYIIRRIVSGFTLMNHWTKYARQLLLYEHMQLSKRIKRYKAAGGNPDIVMLHWTSMGLIMPEIKALFPNAKYVMVEEDVTYLGYQRKYETFKTNQWKRLYETLKKAELNAIKNADLVVTLNQKDTKLLIQDGIAPEKIYTSTLYFENYYDVQRKPAPGNLLFYGAMDRVENYESVIDFIENVMPLLKENDYILNVVGSKPNPKLIAAAEKFNHEAAAHESERGQMIAADNRSESEYQLQGYENNKINVTGFVEDIRPYLSEAMCMVAPLKLGAGIKVKVLEAMSAGVPVLTNDIGIEGIYAKDRKEYIHCTNSEEFANGIKELCNDDSKTDMIGRCGRDYIRDNFNLDSKLEGLMEMMQKL
ncbi:glycosyltransferase [Butyrivibrio sp. AD3002]|uniref:glycosyltransferase n=1 Tax=Butyrivibrio sp. AD3002 TaxID=1280670 RepID=UPI0003B66145|nr:glycosyltransferase [Butyrivibrio sp. AD3002]